MAVKQFKESRLWKSGEEDLRVKKKGRRIQSLIIHLCDHVTWQEIVCDFQFNLGRNWLINVFIAHPAGWK